LFPDAYQLSLLIRQQQEFLCPVKPGAEQLRRALQKNPAMTLKADGDQDTESQHQPIDVKNYGCR
jgi:hypothetical protein